MKGNAMFTVKDIFKIQVAPALGCTEPVAIALGAAAAMSLLTVKEIDTIEIWVDPNIYKNGLAVSIPGTGGLSGLDMASALGAFGGNPALRLEVLESVDDRAVSAARDMVESGRVKVNLLRDQIGLFIRTLVTGNGHTAESLITGLHDNIVSLVHDGQTISESHLLPQNTSANGKSRLMELEDWLKELTLEQLIALLDDLDDEDLKFLESGVDINMRLADYGLKYGPGLGVGRTLERLVRQGLIKRDMMTAARILTSSAADARMSGVKLPAMSSAGSGNHGLTAILPIVAVEKYITVDHRIVLEAIGLSHIITAYVKAHTGRLSAICGCSVAAGAGATAGITYLMGGTKVHIA
ncbi:MAG: serine dehydratase subunit alpha family protein, partial [Desulfatirhabdiaceae bacterium]